MFKVNKPTMIRLQVIPDRTIKTGNVHDLARQLYEVNTSVRKRVDFKNMTYRAKELMTFEIYLSAESVKFYFLVPENWIDYVRNKINAIWPKCTILQSEIIEYPNLVGYVTYKNHDFFALHTARTDYKPLPALLEITKELKEPAIIQINFQPVSRSDWEHDAEQYYDKHRKGEVIEKAGILKMTARLADDIMSEMHSMTTEILGMESKIIKDNVSKLILKHKQGLTEATIRKIKEPVFSTTIKIYSEERTAKTISTALNALVSEDQELVFKKSENSFICSSSELGKLIQLPGSDLQIEYKNIEQVNTRETELPARVSDDKGLWLGTMRLKGKDVNLYMPTSNIDEMCLPHVVIGAMGSGKTKGFGGRLIVEAVNKGYTVIVIDPAMGEMYQEASAGLKPEQIIRIKFGEIPIGLDWQESKHAKNTRSRLASNLIAFIESASDDTGVQTMRYLRSAAKAVPTGKLNEIVELFTNPVYRQKLLKTMPESEIDTWDSFHKQTDAKQFQIAAPILNRLDTVTGDDYLNDCLTCEKGIDFVELIDKGAPGKVIIVDIPKEDVGPEGVNILAALMATKIDMAMLFRKTKHPVFVIQDEPHQYIKSSRTWKAACVESRKYRFCYCFMFHDWVQLPKDLAAIIKSAGVHYHVYTSSKDTFKGLADELRPFTLEEFLEVPRHYALNSIWCDGKKAPVFLAKMAAPPSMKK